MKNKLLPIFITLIFIIIFVIFYKGLKNTNIYTPEKKINNKIPLFSADLFNSNKSINSTELFSSDKFYLLNIWSSWCVPCRQEHPLLMDLAKNKKIKVIGINYKDNKINAQNFLDELGNPYKNIIFDKEGVKSIEWGAYGVPESFLIQNGIILRKYIGPLNNESIKEIKLLIE
ncbi:DsbE family thiol:disulfide interchange protein [Candidatus Pelagibacter bacterium nBUS_30]|uniref:DsbE family thiol:disulfide interchange protein n=1 Tax=Candidatus Pelagibacter bacterium nBUS_30 TaxID=3374191 RepID=UPI003EB95209